MEIRDIPQEVIRRAAEGDLDAFRILYDAASGFVYNVALRVAGDADDAEEVTQDVFLKIYGKLESFRFRSSFTTWVYRIAVNAAFNARKKKSRLRRRETGYDERVAEQAENPVERSLKARENEAAVGGLLALLPPDQRAVIVLREMQGLSYEEMAEILGININTVRSRLRRARETLVKKGRRP